jgi:DNA polymerase-1
MRLEIGYVSETANLERVKNELAHSRLIGIDTETAGKNPFDPFTSKIRLLQVATTSQAYVIDMFRVPTEAVWDIVLEPIWSDRNKVKIFQNGKFDLKFLAETYPDKDVLLSLRSLVDTYIMAKLVEGGNGFKPRSLENLAQEFVGIELDKTFQKYDYRNNIYKEQILYAGLDAAVLIPIYQQLARGICNNKLQKVGKLEFEAIPAVAQLELNGFFLDKDMWLEYAINGKNELYGLEKELRKFFGDINFKSNPQVAEALSKLTGKHVTKTNKDVIQGLIDEYEETVDMFGKRADYREALELFQDFKKKVKLNDAFGENFIKHIHPKTGRIHPNFTQVDTKTGRSTTSDPNLAQIPALEAIRSAFRAPDKSRKIVTLDYSQIELRILAQFGHDEPFIEAFNNGLDVHSMTAANLILKIPFEELENHPRKAQARREAKVYNFGVPYGAGYLMVMSKLKCSEEEAKRGLKNYYADHPDIVDWHKGSEAYFNQYGCVRSFSGRIRNVSDFQWSDQHYHVARQAAKNFPIQASNSDIMKKAITRMWRELPTSVKLVNQVYDEAALECDADEAEEVANRAEQIMIECGEEYIDVVPVKVSKTIDDCWAKD